MSISVLVRLRKFSYKTGCEFVLSLLRSRAACCASLSVRCSLPVFFARAELWFVGRENLRLRVVRKRVAGLSSASCILSQNVSLHDIHFPLAPAASLSMCRFGLICWRSQSLQQHLEQVPDSDLEAPSSRVRIPKSGVEVPTQLFRR